MPWDYTLQGRYCYTGRAKCGCMISCVYDIESQEEDPVEEVEDEWILTEIAQMALAGLVVDREFVGKGGVEGPYFEHCDYRKGCFYEEKK